MTKPCRRTLLLGGAGALIASGASAQSLVDSPENWTTMSREKRDAAYNNSLAVPEAGKITASWDAASARLRAAHKATMDLAYGPRERNRWDLFPAEKPDAPCLVFIHGGFWQARSRETFACMIEGVRAAGLAAALPGYTLAPDAPLTEIVAEIRTALDWLSREGGKHGIRGPVILSGWSAGGHLAAMHLDHPSVKAGFAISGLYELAPLRDTYVNDKLRLTDREVAELSPLRLDATDKPLTLAYGSAELSPLVENTRVFHAFRSAQHVAGSLIPVPHANHFSVLEALRDRNGVLARQVIEIAGDLVL